MLTVSCREILPWGDTRDYDLDGGGEPTHHFGFKYEEAVELFKFRRLSKHFFGHIELPSQSVRIPSAHDQPLSKDTESSNAPRNLCRWNNCLPFKCSIP
jgi:hypothetical protein